MTTSPQDLWTAPRGCAPTTLSSSVDLPPTLRAPAAARRAVRATLTAWGCTDPETRDAVELIVTELVTNAICHTGPAPAPPRLHLESSAEGLWIAVSDTSATPVIPRDFTDTAESGRGMGIITTLAIAWGVVDHPGGKQVWARLAARPGSAEDGAVRLPGRLPS